MAKHPDQDRFEPEYPENQQACDRYCRQLVDALRSRLDNRLVSVILFGSWARGEAEPGRSDIDLTVVIDTVDDSALRLIRAAWLEARVGYCNIYGLDELPAMSREALQSHTVNAVVLYGTNPFPDPTVKDFADDLARNAEMVARMARNLVYAYWMTGDEIWDNLSYLLGKQCLKRAIGNLLAFRTGAFPKNFSETEELLRQQLEWPFFHWLNELSDQEKRNAYGEIARKLSHLAGVWLREIDVFYQKMRTGA